MVYIPAGPFYMGSRNGETDERPVRKITLSAFCIDQHEFTKRDFDQVLHQAKAKGIRIPSPLPDDKGPQYPLTGLNSEEARLLCEIQGKDLPTEPQWEKAAKGRRVCTIYGTKKSNCESITPQTAVFNSKIGPAEVCSKRKNGYGLCDMSGNVWEWTRDWYN